jgi:hypothetical protein
MNAWHLLGLLTAAAAGAAELPCDVSWIGNDWGGNPAWVLQDVDDLFVAPEGDVFTHVDWEEGGGNVMRFDRGGAWQGAAMHTHGWGYCGGEAVAANAKYVFIAQWVENERGHLVDADTWPPDGFRWWGVSRRLRADAAKPAPFEGGKGGRKGDTLKGCFKVVTERPADEAETIRGLWATETELFVAVKREGVVRVYDAETLAEKRSWRMARPDRMAMDANGTLWLLLAPEDEKGGAWELAGVDADGKTRARMAFGTEVWPTDLAVDARGRLLVSDAGVAQQILLFDGLAEGRPRACGTFGERFGIFGGPVPGRVGERRFNRPRGVGCDAAGNLYVASGGGTGGGGTVLESYAPDGALRWRRCGLFFVDLPDLGAADGTVVWSKEERFTLDLAKPAGIQAGYAAYTVNPWKYPDDPRIHIWSANAWFLTVRGRPLLFVSNMGQDILEVFRFNPKTDGETAIPAALFAKRKVRTQTREEWPRGAPAAGAWCWRDRNGDGAMQAGEFEAVAREGGGCVFVDGEATVWRVFKEEASGAVFKGFAADGVPAWGWEAPRRVPRPGEVSELRRFKVDPARDLAAFGGDSGEDKHQHWKPMGPAVAVYRDVLKGAPARLWSAVLPYGKGSKGHESAEPMSFEIAGDYLFVCYTRGLREEGVKWAFVKVYGLTDGRFVGNLVPERVTGELGLLDLEDSLRVHRLRDGSYLLFLEDDYKAKSVMMRWKGE